MAQKKSYSRYFIILQEDETGYSLASDKLPSGYTKLETKNDRCKISYYAQNLKKDKEPYYMVLICNKRDTKKLIKLGVLNIDDYGRAEITYEFAADNILESKMPVEAIGGAAIVRIEGSDIISVMSGFTSAEPPTDWRSYNLFEDRSRELKTESVPVVEKVKEEPKVEVNVKLEEDRKEQDNQLGQNEEKNIFDKYEEEIEAVKNDEEVREEDNSNEIIEVDYEVEDVEQPLNSSTETGTIIREESENSGKTQSSEKSGPSEIGSNQPEDDQYRKKHHDNEKKDDHCHDDYQGGHKHEEHEEHHDHHEHHGHEEHEDHHDYHGHKKMDYAAGTVGEFFKLVSEGLEEESGVCTEIKNCKWHKVHAKCINDMCNASNYNKYAMVYYPMISYYPYIKKQEHYLLGYKYDSQGNIKYIIYGIPGTKKRSDQPYEGRSGFVTWVPLKEGDERDDSMGYWLMFYDFRTSTIVIPIK